MKTTTNALTFHNTEFDLITRDGEPWLRLPQIAEALGYAKGGAQSEAPFGMKKLRTLYERHADEFTNRMTALVDLPTAGGVQQTRIFSLRGCYALGMFARTEQAKAFRVWVLDLLERGAPMRPVPKPVSFEGRMWFRSEDLVRYYGARTIDQLFSLAYVQKLQETGELAFMFGYQMGFGALAVAELAERRYHAEGSRELLKAARAALRREFKAEHQLERPAPQGVRHGDLFDGGLLS